MNESLHPAIQSLFDRAFAKPLRGKRTGPSVLAIGEGHGVGEHCQLLQTQLPCLIREYNIGTLGVELPHQINAFFMEYEEAVRQNHLRPNAERLQKKRAYLKEILESATEHSEAAGAHADLYIAAIEQGIRVVACDTRRSREETAITAEEKERAAYLTMLDGRLDYSFAYEAERRYVEKGKYIQYLRDFPEKLAVFMATLAEQIVAENPDFYDKHPQWKQKIAADLQHIRLSFDGGEAALTCPVIAPTQTLVAAGRIHDISSDALAATMLVASAVPQKNILYLGGALHLTGKSDSGKEADVQGTLVDHFRALKCRVTPVLLANSKYMNFYKTELTKEIQDPGDGMIVTQDPLSLINVETGEETVLRQPELSFREKFARHPQYVPFEFRYQNEHANPTLLPEIHKAMAAIQAAWNAGRGQGLQAEAYGR